MTTANRFAANVVPVIRDIERAGVTTLQGIADALNARGIRTARGRRWYATTVKNVLNRAGDQQVSANESGVLAWLEPNRGRNSDISSVCRL